MTNEVFGRPIEGEIRHEYTQQDDPMAFINALDEVLNYPGVIEYKWTQYTPYWNDGEECEFTVMTDWHAGVKLEFGDEDGGEMGDGFYTWYDINRRSELNDVNLSELQTKLTILAGKMGNGSHEAWLKETFGDHATVTATKEGFKVEFYDHD